MDVVPEECPEECPICYDKAPQVALPCGHMFCQACIGNHKKACQEGLGLDYYGPITATCPLCRASNVQESPVGDRLKAAIQKQVDDNLSLANKNIAFTSAADDARWSPLSATTDWSKVTRIKVHR